MTHKWVEKKTEEWRAQFKDYPQVLIDAWEEIPAEYRNIKDNISGRRIVDFIQKLKDDIASGAKVDPYDINWLHTNTSYEWVTLYFRHDKNKIKKAKKYYKWFSNMAWNYWFYLQSPEYYFSLEDKSMEFDGDIVITDPCYFAENAPKEIRYTYYGDEMESYGIKGIKSTTHYGDWSCTTYDRTTIATKGQAEPIGEFCADAGMVCVCDLNSVLKFNPLFDCHTKNPKIVTWIKDFKGTAKIKIKEAPDKKSYVVSVVGKGINKVTGAPIDFYTEQTGY